jgi:transitional endoplasmic reticulum ATPase
VIECPVPNKEARHSILSIHTRGMPISDDVDLMGLADITVGFVGADIDHMCKESVYRSAERIFGFDSLLEADSVEVEDLEITMGDMDEAFERVRPSIKRRFSREVAKKDFDSIVGHSAAKEALRDKILDPLMHPDLYEVAGLSIGSGILLHGPPGTGKTALARAAANISGSQFIGIKGPELLSKWQGESERAVRNLMDKARKMAPCILFFDEFDSIGSDRSLIGPGHSGMSSVVNQLLTELDGIDSRDGVLIMAATNRKDLIDPAFLREGRIGTHVRVDLPLPEEYSDIVEIHLGEAPRSELLELDAAVGALPPGMSGADLAGIGRRIREIAIKRHLNGNPDGGTEGFCIEQSDVMEACGIVSESESGRMETIQIEPLD